MSPRAEQPPSSPTSRILIICLVLAGVSGAVGVMSLAQAAHADPSGRLLTAGQMLLFHAPVFLGLGLLSQIRRVPMLPAALVLLAAGVGLFSGDLTARVHLGTRLFPMAAPAGGLLTVLGWIALSACALRVKAKNA